MSLEVDGSPVASGLCWTPAFVVANSHYLAKATAMRVGSQVRRDLLLSCVGSMPSAW